MKSPVVMPKEWGVEDLLYSFKTQLKIMVKICILFILCGGLIGYLMPSKFETKIELLIDSSSEGEERVDLPMAEIETNLRLIETYKQIMTSDRIRNRVNEELGEKYSKSAFTKRITISSGNDSQIITVLATERELGKTVTLANNFASIFQDEIHNLMHLNNVVILTDSSTEPHTKNLKPSIFFYSAISGAFGILFCIGICFVQEMIFPKLNSERKVKKTFHLPLLGTIMSKSPVELCGTHRLIGLFNQTSIPSVEYQDFKDLAATIHYHLTREVKVILLTSSDTDDGKTFIGGNLAAQLALDNKKTLFIDADFRRPDGRYFFDLPKRSGLVTVLAGQESLSQILQQTKIPNLSFISTGPIPPNPTLFLQKEKMRNVMNNLKSMYEVILIDVAALSVSDAIALQPYVDGNIVVINARQSTKGKALEGIRYLEKMEGTILGMILNHG